MAEWTMLCPAIMNMLFAICFALLFVLFSIDATSEMFDSTIKRFQTLPWQTEPTKTMYDVRGGPEVYTWLHRVFVPQLYASFSEMGASSDFCTAANPCLLGEGDVDTDQDCAGSLVAGHHNCPAFMGPGDCCEACSGSDCPNQTIPTMQGEVTGSTAVTDLSASCENQVEPPFLMNLPHYERDAGIARRLDEVNSDAEKNSKKGDEEDAMPSWFHELAERNRGLHAFLSPAQADETVEEPPTRRTSGTSTFAFCPERMAKQGSDISTRIVESLHHVMLGQYNKVIMGRITMKRMKMTQTTDWNFGNAYPEQPLTAFMRAAEHESAVEDTSSFGDDPVYSYAQDKGFYHAGGFIEYLDFDQSMDQMLVFLAHLHQNFWFDSQQGSFTIELMVFNGNIDKFMYVSISFEHSFSGITQVRLDACPLDFTLHDWGQPLSYVRYSLYLLIVIIWCVMTLFEIDDLNNDPKAYFSNMMSLISFWSLLISFVFFVLYVRTVMSHTYFNFALPLTGTSAEKKRQFDDLVDMASQFKLFLRLLSINACLVFVSTVAQLTVLAPRFGIVWKTIQRQKEQLIAFFTIFFFSIVGFTFAGQVLFGNMDAAWSNFFEGMISVVQMTMLDDNLGRLRLADINMGYYYFMFFHIFFLIIKQILLSILINGYKVEKDKALLLEGEAKFPLRLLWNSVQRKFRQYGNLLGRCILLVQNTLFGAHAGGINTSANYDQAEHLRTWRVTRPRFRNVVYESKPDKPECVCDISRDVKLRAEMPVYPDGMMQYYVEFLDREGPAEDMGVRPGYRLVGISEANQPRTDFRKCSEEFHKNPQAILKSLGKRAHTLPVKLEFEGGVPPFSWNCGWLIIFLVNFLTFVFLVSRVELTYFMSASQVDLLMKPEWYAHNPDRVMSLERISDVENIHEWVQAAILDGEYACTTKLSSGEDCSRQDLTNIDRQNWVLYTGAADIQDARALAEKPLQAPLPQGRPAALEGLSLGYIPYLSPTYAGLTQTQTSVQQLMTQEYNMGIMVNNHVRLSFKAPCFVNNSDDKWSGGYPFVLQQNFRDEATAGDVCLNSLGAEQNWETLTGEQSKLPYSYVKREGSGAGSFAAGFGGTRKEAERVYRILQGDEFLGRKASALTFELIKYNGNYDLFLNTKVTFNLRPTGKLETRIHTDIFPLNPFSQKSRPDAVVYTTLNLSLFISHTILSILFVGYILWDLSLQYRINMSLERSRWSFLLDFFVEDWWNILEVVSSILNVMIVYFFFGYAFIGDTFEAFSGTWLTSWTLNSEFTIDVTSQTVDLLNNYDQAGQFYSGFIWSLALNSVCLTFRMIKFFGGLKSLRLMLITVASCVGEVLVMSVVVILMMIGFVFMFYNEYCVVMTRFGTFLQTFSELFLFLVGTFGTAELRQYSFSFFFTAFIFYEITFFLLIAMFLAAIVYRWKETRKDATEVSLEKTIRTLQEHLVYSWYPQRQAILQGENRRKLDTEFWRNFSALQHLQNLSKHGRAADTMNLAENGGAEDDGQLHDEGNAEEEKKSEEGDDEKDDFGEEEQEEDTKKQEENDGPHRKEDTEHQLQKFENDPTKFMRIFKRAHMEIASKMCRDLPARRMEDRGAGISHFLEDEEKQQGRLGGQAEDDIEDKDYVAKVEIGIVEELQPEEEREKIAKALHRKLETSDTAEEVWLDSLMSVVEQALGLEKLQSVFMPMPMILPKKPQEWGKFNEKKDKMEQRLNLFLRWMQEESRIEHYKFLKKMSEAKVRMLKQQSLVMFDYLEALGKQIDELQKEITVLDRQNSMIRARVSPLL
jgi:hypothetical protein